MSKPLITTLITILFLGISAFSVSSHLSGIDKSETITIQKEEIELLNGTVTSLMDENEQLVQKVDELDSYIVKLEGKLVKYKAEIKTLKGKAGSYEKRIATKDQELAKLRADYFKLEKDLEVLINTKNSDQAKIVDLTNMIQQLRVEMDNAYANNVDNTVELEEVKKDLLEVEVEKTRIERLRKIIDITTINYKAVQIREFKDSKNLNKINNSGKKWNYTIVDFLMQNSDMMSLIDESFIIKIVDTDTKLPLSHIETNPMHPESSNNKTGKIFQYDGDNVVQYFKNTDLKEGKNYEVQIYYLEGDNEYLLKNGTKQFIFNKKIANK